MSLKIASDASFDADVRGTSVTLVDFGAVWCPPCKALLPIMEELAGQYGDRLTVLKVDCDDSPATAGRFGVMSMPTVIVFKDGEPVDKLVGLRPKAVYETSLAKVM